MPSEREKKLEAALVRFLEPVRGVPFEVVVKALYGKEVRQFDRQNSEDRDVLTKIVSAMRSAVEEVRRTPIERPRPNEVGNDMEPFVINALRVEGLTAACPLTISGKGKSTGYPDVLITSGYSKYYVEVKTYAAANHDTTQRSFYLSPSHDHKVANDGVHLLVGFEMLREGNLFTPNAFCLVDLYGLDCDVKAEFQSDNRRMYEAERRLHYERIEPLA